MRNIWLYLVAGWALFSVSALAMAGDGTVTCAGTVVDGKGRPLAGVAIEAYAWDVDRWRGAMAVRSLAKAVTTKDGRFSFKVRKRAVRMMSVVLARKKGVGLDWVNWPGGLPGECTLTLSGETVLAGTVVDEAGKPAAGAEVRPILMTRSGPLGVGVLACLAPMDLLVSRTDAKGRFRFTGIPQPATAEFAVVAGGKAKTLTYRRGVRFGRYHAGQTNIRIKLPDEAKISGVVVAKKTGQPVAGVRVTATGARGESALAFDVVTTGKDGAFTIGGLPAGRCAAITLGPKTGLGKWAPAAARAEVKAGKTTGGLKLELVEGGVLEVSLRNAKANAPIVGGEVMLTPLSRDGRRQPPSVFSGPDGLGRIRLAPGSYRVTTFLVVGYERRDGGQEAEIAAGKTTRLETKLYPLPVLKGVVRDAAGKPVEGAEIFVSPSRLAPLPGMPAVRADGQGRFEMTLRGGRLDDSAYVMGRAAARNLIGSAKIGKGFEAPIEIKLAPGARITGGVVGLKGKPIAGAKVSAFELGGGFWMGSPRFSVVADTKGRYEMSALSVGRRYTVAASAPGHGLSAAIVDIPAKLKGPVKVEKIVLKLANLSISGVVLGRDGKPIAGAMVFAAGDGQRIQQPTHTDEKGKFKIEGLCAGEVQISAQSPAVGARGSAEASAGETDVKIQLEAPPDLPPTPRPAPPDEDF